MEAHSDETQLSKKGWDWGGGALAAEPEEYQIFFCLDLDSF